ncbi:MAG TPA: ATP-dependent DNA helicase, partial [Candidatus Thermoplasmatota archaeon]|nr:ATP-dependent DNA helicase [Candidatus Thermoplasmatota archaeon]
AGPQRSLAQSAAKAEAAMKRERAPRPRRKGGPQEDPDRAPVVKEPQRPPDITLPAGADLFPYSTIREGQRQFIRDVMEAAKTRSHLVANAPTGLGKTVSTLAPLLAYALENKKRVFFLTSKQSQHKIAVDTLKAIRQKSGLPFVVSDIIGKQDMCPRREARELFSKQFAEFCRREMIDRQCSYYNQNLENQGTPALRVLKARPHHVEEAVISCTDFGVCPHATALDLAAQAHVVVCDYNYFFSDLRETITERLKIDLSDILLVVDEAHNLPERIRDHLSLELNDFTLEEALEDARDLGDRRLETVLEGFKELLFQMLESPPQANVDKAVLAEAEAVAGGGRGGNPANADERYVQKDEFIERVNKMLAAGRRTLTHLDYDSFLSEVKAGCEEFEKEFKEEARGLGAAREFLQNWKRERFGLARILTRGTAPTLHYKILDPSVLSRPVFDSIHASVVMSGTLHPMEMYRDVLGLDPKRTRTAYYDSPFPKANRLLLIDNQVSTAYTDRTPEMFDRIAQHLCAVANEVPGNAAAFFPSYSILEEVRRHVPRYLKKELIVEEREHDKAAKERLVQDIRDMPEDALLMGVQGGSLSEGYDYEGNLLKAVVIVGLPFAAPSLDVQSLIGYYEQKFGQGAGRDYAYVYPTMNRVLQAAGRSIRTPTDKGVIVLMDKRFSWSSYRRCYPRDFVPRETGDIQGEMRRFWRGLER